MYIYIYTNIVCLFTWPKTEGPGPKNALFARAGQAMGTKPASTGAFGGGAEGAAAFYLRLGEADPGPGQKIHGKPYYIPIAVPFLSPLFWVGVLGFWEGSPTKVDKTGKISGTNFF